MRFDDNGGGSPNYEPNSFEGPTQGLSLKEPPLRISGDADRYDHRVGNEDYSQPGNLFRMLTTEEKDRLIGNIVRSMKSVPREIQLRQIGHFYRADSEYGRGVARGLGFEKEIPRIAREVKGTKA
jgi:catalase